MNDTETLADKAKKIGEDIAAVWDILREKGGVIPHKLNTENLQDIFSQIRNLNWYAAVGAFFFDGSGVLIEYFTKHEVAVMEEMPELPEGATGWTTDLETLKADMLTKNAVFVGTVPAAVTGEHRIHITIDTDVFSTVPIRFKYTNSEPTVGTRIDWGDGNYTILTASSSYQEETHTYQTSGDYVIKIQTDGAGVLMLGGESSKNIFGAVGTSTSSLGTKIMGNVTKIEIGTGIQIGQYVYAQYSTGLSSSAVISTGAEEITFASGIIDIPAYAFLGQNVVNLALPSTVSNIGEWAFTYCHNLESVLFAGDAHHVNLKQRAFYYCTSLADLYNYEAILSIAQVALSGSKIDEDVVEALTEDEAIKKGREAFGQMTVNTLNAKRTAQDDTYWMDGIKTRYIKFYPGFGDLDTNQVAPASGSDLVQIVEGYNVVSAPANGVFGNGIFYVTHLTGNLIIDMTGATGTPSSGIWSNSGGRIQTLTIKGTLGAQTSSFSVWKMIGNGTDGRYYSANTADASDAHLSTYLTNGVKCIFECHVDHTVGSSTGPSVNTPPWGNFQYIIFDGGFSGEVSDAAFYYTGLENVSKKAYYDGKMRIDFSNNDSIPVMSSTKQPGDTNAPFFVGQYVEPLIIVPDDLYDDWVTATNWSNWADYIVKASEA